MGDCGGVGGGVALCVRVGCGFGVAAEHLVDAFAGVAGGGRGGGGAAGAVDVLWDRGGGASALAGAVAACGGGAGGGAGWGGGLRGGGRGNFGGKTVNSMTDMNLNELKAVLAGDPGRFLRLRLPGGGAVPVSFHITEVGQVTKDFIDCGGTRRQVVTCQLQAWVGPDEEHRIQAGKLLGILEKGAGLLPSGEVPVEIEYEQGLISQYPVTGVEVEDGGLVFRLASKHTDCLAKELCLPQSPVAGMFRSAFAAPGPCCGPGGCD